MYGHELHSPVVDDGGLWDIWFSTHRLPAMMAANELGVFDALCAGPKTLEQLATQLQTDARATGVLLSLLGSLRLVERRGAQWQGTLIARTYLDPSSRFFWGRMLDAFKEHNPLCERMVAALRRQKDIPRISDGWEKGEVDSEVAQRIADFMRPPRLAAAIGAARGIDLKGVRRLLDVGGGSGVFSIEFARQWPELKATVMDLEPMCNAARRYIDSDGLGERVDTLAKNMFLETWPSDYDAILFSNVFHDWDDEQCADLSAKAFHAMPPGGRIYLHQALLDENRDGPTTTAAFSMQMQLGTRGRQYAFSEYRDFLEGAGFRSVTSTPTWSYYSIVSAVRP